MYQEYTSKMTVVESSILKKITSSYFTFSEPSVNVGALSLIDKLKVD